MVKYIVVHNKHEGCYDFHCYQDEVAKLRITSITINPPKIFMFETRDQAQDFFEEYLHDIDTIDNRCRKDGDIEHVEFCTCGIIELDRDENPILFYNKRNQIFLLEHGTEVFMPHIELKEDINNMNLTNKLIRRCKSLTREQRKQYIELGRYCEECNSTSSKEANDESTNETNSVPNNENEKSSKDECKIDHNAPITAVNTTNSENIVISSVPPVHPVPPATIDQKSNEHNEPKPKRVVKKAVASPQPTSSGETVQNEEKPKKTISKKAKSQVEGVSSDSNSVISHPSDEKPKKQPKKQSAKKLQQNETH